jgi:hypothetical protein
VSAIYSYHWREDDSYGDLVTVHEAEPFADLVGALGGRDQATRYVELGGRADSYRGTLREVGLEVTR